MAVYIIDFSDLLNIYIYIIYATCSSFRQNSNGSIRSDVCFHYDCYVVKMMMDWKIHIYLLGVQCIYPCTAVGNYGGALFSHKYARVRTHKSIHSAYKQLQSCCYCCCCFFFFSLEKKRVKHLNTHNGALYLRQIHISSN